MLTVAILINGNPIMARSAVRGKRLPDGRVAYLVDDGATVQHDPDDGAVALARKLLDRIDEQRVQHTGERRDASVGPVSRADAEDRTDDRRPETTEHRRGPGLLPGP